MTSLEQMAELRRCHSSPPVGFPGLPGRSDGSYQGSGAAAVCASTVAIHAGTRAMTAHCWPPFRASFTKPLHPCSHTDGEIRDAEKPHKKHRSAPWYTDTLVYDFIPERLYTFKQTQKTVIVWKQLSGAVHLHDCRRTTVPLLMRLAACEWEVRHAWPFSWLRTFNLPSTHPSGSDNTKQTLEREPEKKPDANGFSIVCKSALICLLSVLRDRSRAVGKNKLQNRNAGRWSSLRRKQFKLGVWPQEVQHS